MNNDKFKQKNIYIIVITKAHPFAQETIPEKYND